jgi:peptidoglycan/LPS O-acetylase OafA/YrhL
MLDRVIEVKHNNRLENNNFDLLRFLFAATVCLVHSFSLSGYQELSGISQVLSSEIAVKAFFVLSGFLIFMSYERSSSLKSYTYKRIRRVYPAYFVVVVFSAIVLFLISTDTIENYFSIDWLKYVIANLTFLNFLHPTLPGVFDNNILNAVNGALWTIKIEVMFYFSVPLIGYLFKKFPRVWVLLFFYGLSVIYSLSMAELASSTQNSMFSVLGRQLPGQMSYFMAGALLYYYFPIFERKMKYTFSLAIVLMMLNSFISLSFLLPMVLAIIVVFFGVFMYLGNFGKYGDFSYGIYIIHFPVIQFLLANDLASNNPFIFIVSVLIITILGAVGMWHIVEKRFLLRSNHYRQAVS